MPMIAPWAILAMSVALLYAVWQFDRLATRRRMNRLRALALDAKVHYSRVDRFDIACRLKEHFPIAGCEDLSVHDLMYRRGNGCYAYVFTADYRGIGNTGRRRVVAAVDEPADRSLTIFETIKMADASLPLVDQYRALLAQEC